MNTFWSSTWITQPSDRPAAICCCASSLPSVMGASKLTSSMLRAASGEKSVPSSGSNKEALFTSALSARLC
ncbi:hypothetical protein D9M69_660080 [compost metagenome]